jgi:peptidoglycan/xylan/chitin deacetylase (PgdA/CDA1 family)
MPQTIATLCFHSGNPTDYLVLPEVLNTLLDCDFTVISALRLVQYMRNGTLAQLPGKTCVLTFDDGQDMDFVDVMHPTHGAQPSFASMLRDVNARAVTLGREFKVHATSFVIASPLTRAEIQEKEMLGYPWMSDRWWQAAVASGLFHIASHSYDHLSHSASTVRQHANVRGDFSYVDANWQVRKARELIEFIAPNPAIAKGSALFCYPYGHVSRYLHDDYFPNQLDEHGSIGAFTTEPALIDAGTSVFAIPRFVLGESWHTPSDLAWLR